MNPDTNNPTPSNQLKVTNRDYLFFGFVVFAAFIVTILSVILAYQIKKVEEGNTNEGTQVNPSTDIYWEISQIKPNEDNVNNFDVTVASNAGSIREYSDLISFGLSKDGLKLATNSLNGLEIVDLESDTAKNVQTPTEVFRGDSGNVISWSSNSEYFALSIINNQNTSDTRIWIFKENGDVQNEVEALLPTYNRQVITVEPVHFSKNGELVLTRTYLDEDALEVDESGKKYIVSALPIYLAVFDINGKKVKELMVRDFDTSGTDIVYGWDTKIDRFIKYKVYEPGETVDLSQDYLFTKISI